ncbi:TIGR03618 family F420-dependent PPOX class oxidoreductase [Sanguibacter sp. 25GB23B1]|uniref:TIGR03618 family F420-dependent PPOX class oxidoreductase n=1 Tax=unclassified Sanguibacter TaxID=2645534 RepID=UPI0032AFCB7A
MGVVRLSASAAAVLAAARVIWVTTLRLDGSPHVTPTWFVADEDRLWLVSARTNVKVRNVEADPRVSVAVDGTTDNALVAEGHATVRTLDEVPHQILDGLEAKYAWDPRDPDPDGERVGIEITVSRWLLGY